MNKTLLTLLSASLLFALSASISAKEHSDLYNQIKHADRTFFEAFNTCDLDTIATMFSKDLEFYHDIAGLGFYDDNVSATKELCARDLDLKRTLLVESMEIYPVKDFGAIQIGQHRFCHEVNGKDDCGTFGFTHLWKQTNEGWRLHRVISYGH